MDEGTKKSVTKFASDCDLKGTGIKRKIWKKNIGMVR